MMKNRKQQIEEILKYKNTNAYWVVEVDDDTFLTCSPKLICEANAEQKDAFLRRHSLYRIPISYITDAAHYFKNKHKYIEELRSWKKNPDKPLFINLNNK